MALLYFFAFLAGLATVLSPCILPILPAILSAGVGKGKRRPLGVVIGLISSFTFFTLTLTFLVKSFGVSADLLRIFAVIILVFFGLVMLFPRLSEWFSAISSSIANLGTRFQSKPEQTETGFFSGFILGLALGLVWTPCAGPILAAITTLVATQSVTLQAVFLTIAYSVGAAIPLFLIMYGGNKALRSSRYLSQHAEGIRQFFGALMIAFAAALFFNVDTLLQQKILEYFPKLTIENQPIVKQALNTLRQDDSPLARETPPQFGENLPKIAQAPPIEGIENWLNTQNEQAPDLKGKIVLVDFWTYSCINCLRTLPYLTQWYDTYKDKGFIVIGVHTPEFEFEKNEDNVKKAVQRLHIQYPVALDNEYKTWGAFHNQYWPAHYLIDREGIVRQVHFGEGGYTETENAIRALLNETPLIKQEEPIKKIQRPMTAETYLGYKRAGQYTVENHIEPDKIVNYSYSAPIEKDGLGLTGKWKVEEERITAEGTDSFLVLNFLSNRVYLVLSGSSQQPINVTLDGKPLSSFYYTSDMNKQGEIFVDEDRKYDIVNLQGQYGRHVLKLHLPKGVSAYAFTFGDQE